jgi:hypothetical protein
VTLDGGGGGGGPYQNATDQNTSRTWLDDIAPIDVNLHGMGDFAKNLITVSNDLFSHQQHVMGQISSILEENAFAGGFPEVNYAAKLHSQNLSEFAQYLSGLWQAIQHTANAAQVIADSYSSTDGWSAASLDAVNFAFGDPNAKRPSGLPPGLGKTWSQKQAEDEAQSAATGPTAANGHPDSHWQLVNTSTDGAGNSYSTYQDQYGETRQINVTHQDGHKITTITTPQGTTTTTESTVSYPYGSTTTRTTTTPDGRTTTSTVNTSSSANSHTTQNVDSSGKVTSSTTTTHNSDGSVTETTSSYDGQGHPTPTNSVTYGQESPGVGNAKVNSPAADIEQSLKKDAMPKPEENHTQVLAPGAPGSSSSSSSGVTA